MPKEQQFGNLRNCATARGFEIKTNSNKDLAESLDKSVDPSDPVVNKVRHEFLLGCLYVCLFFNPIPTKLFQCLF